MLEAVTYPVGRGAKLIPSASVFPGLFWHGLRPLGVRTYLVANWQNLCVEIYSSWSTRSTILVWCLCVCFFTRLAVGKYIVYLQGRIACVQAWGVF